MLGDNPMKSTPYEKLPCMKNPYKSREMMPKPSKPVPPSRTTIFTQKDPPLLIDKATHYHYHYPLHALLYPRTLLILIVIIIINTIKFMYHSNFSEVHVSLEL